MDTDERVLLGLARLGEGYGVPIRREIEEVSGRPISLAAVYAALDRLERDGLAESWLTDPLPERGGRARKHYRVTAAGVAVLREARASLQRLWRGVELPADGSGS